MNSRTYCAAIIATCLIVVLTGCESLGQDLGDMANSLIPKTPTEAARMALDPHDPDSRREGTMLISNSPFGGAEVYTRMYRDYVENEQNPLVLAEAIRALARHGTPPDAPLVARHLTHPNEQVRWEAAKGLQRLHNPQVVDALLTVLRNEQEKADIRTAAATALGQYPQDKVFQTLVRALDSRELAVNDAAANSLECLTGQSLGLEPEPWLAWYAQAAESRAVFSDQQEYLFPTFNRDESLLEKIAFWSSPVREIPAPPAGLSPESERSTYPDDKEAMQDGPDG